MSQARSPRLFRRIQPSQRRTPTTLGRLSPSIRLSQPGLRKLLTLVSGAFNLVHLRRLREDKKLLQTIGQLHEDLSTGTTFTADERASPESYRLCVSLAYLRGSAHQYYLHHQRESTLDSRCSRCSRTFVLGFRQRQAFRYH